MARTAFRTTPNHLTQSHRGAGFTIVELLIVIVVIAILATITIVSYNGIQARAIETTMKSDLRVAATSLELDRTNTGSYPGSASEANGGEGLRLSGNNALSYTGGGESYCVSVSNPSTTIKLRIRSSEGLVAEGSCEPFVSTVAGSGTTGNTDGTGTAARFNAPMDIAMDASGTLYIADGSNHRIRKITPTGVVSTLAGSSYGFADGTGTAAKFNYPFGIAVDGAGYVYVADYANHRIRKISPAGVVTTLAGSATYGFADGAGTAAQFTTPYDVAVDSAGTVYVADMGNNRIGTV